MGATSNHDGGEEDTDTIIDQMIADSTVAIFSKSYCPHCKKVKEFFTNNGISYTSVDLDIMGQIGAEIQSTLLQRTGQSTVPSVWVNQKFIGKSK